MDGRTDGRSDIWLEGQMHGRTDERTARWTSRAASGRARRERAGEARRDDGTAGARELEPTRHVHASCAAWGGVDKSKEKTPSCLDQTGRSASLDLACRAETLPAPRPREGRRGVPVLPALGLCLSGKKKRGQAGGQARPSGGQAGAKRGLFGASAQKYTF